jgi:hypothetical protein
MGQGVRVDALMAQLDRVQLGAAVAQAKQRPVVGGALDDDLVARVDRWSNRKASACSEPLVTRTRSGSTPCLSAIQLRSRG